MTKRRKNKIGRREVTKFKKKVGTQDSWLGEENRKIKTKSKVGGRGENCLAMAGKGPKKELERKIGYEQLAKRKTEKKK